MRAVLDLFGQDPAHAHMPALSGGFLPLLPGMDALPIEPLPIAGMAEMFGVTHRTLHFYEEKGLITPQRSGAMRCYGPASILRMMVIATCREIGMPLADIQDLMDRLGKARSQSEADELFRRVLTVHRRELVAEISLITRKITRIRTIVSNEGPEISLGSHTAPPDRLSEIEKRCLALMTEGYKGASLALALGICSGDLLRLEDAIITKLDAGNRYQAAAKAILSGMLPN